MYIKFSSCASILDRRVGRIDSSGVLSKYQVNLEVNWVTVTGMTHRNRPASRFDARGPIPGSEADPSTRPTKAQPRISCGHLAGSSTVTPLVPIWSTRAVGMSKNSPVIRNRPSALARPTTR